MKDSKLPTELPNNCLKKKGTLHCTFVGRKKVLLLDQAAAYGIKLFVFIVQKVKKRIKEN